MRKIEVVPHNPKWQNEFEIESRLIVEALGKNFVAIDHIGSTAISGIYAKPIKVLLLESLFLLLQLEISFLL